MKVCQSFRCLFQAKRKLSKSHETILVYAYTSLLYFTFSVFPKKNVMTLTATNWARNVTTQCPPVASTLLIHKHNAINTI